MGSTTNTARAPRQRPEPQRGDLHQVVAAGLDRLRMLWGSHDGVAPDEWVSAEYAKTRWVYAQLGLADRTKIEYSNGGHTIYGAGTFDFLHEKLNWPKR